MEKLNKLLADCLLLSVFITGAVKAETAAVNFSVLDVDIAVDLNRDGKVEFATKQDLPTATTPDVFPTDLTFIEKDDGTRTIVPYRFWLNNDLDVVNDDGSIAWHRTSCERVNPGYSSNSEYQQTCEQWDEEPKSASNTSVGHLNKIESYRDLEDFLPLKIKINPNLKSYEYDWVLHAQGVSVNMFQGAWDDQNPSHAYIYDNAMTKLQVYTANLKGNIFVSSGQSYTLDYDDINGLFDLDGIGRFIVEGVSSSNCVSNPHGCYLSISYKKKGSTEVIEEKKVYLDFHKIEDYYDLAKAGPSASEVGERYATLSNIIEYLVGLTGSKEIGYHAFYDGSGVNTEKTAVLNIYDDIYPANDLIRDYIVQIHGWRMRDSEKKSFSETSFKRLYWSGYKGRMGALHWPTGWFDKPADVYGPAVLAYVLTNERNYDVSEAVARRVGVDLVAWLSNLNYSNKHIIAHSMGNVVASEALLNGGADYVDSYAAGQAASAAGSYDSAAADMAHKIEVPGKFSCAFQDQEVINSVEEAWRCYNIDNSIALNDTPFDMPPDMYRYDWIQRDAAGEPVTNINNGYNIIHPKTTNVDMGPNLIAPGERKTHRFEGIGEKVNIVNLYNSEDAALKAWEFNQLTKPDYAQGDSWDYSNDYLEARKAYDDCLKGGVLANCDTPPVEPTEVTAIFTENGEEVQYDTNTEFDILAYVIPARTEPLGQAHTSGEIKLNPPELDGLTSSNQDHSAPYHGYYSERSVKNDKHQRAAYWNLVLSESLGLSVINYTGLKNTIK